MTQHDLLTMLEAARWAPSSFNSQPWRFVYALRDSPHWLPFLELLVPFNRAWAENASAIVILISCPSMRPPGAEKDVPSRSHSLDAGAAAASFAFQATLMGWFVHGMAGFDIDRASTALTVPREYRIEAAYAVGRLGEVDVLPEKLRSREAPSERRPLRELAFEGTFAV